MRLPWPCIWLPEQTILRTTASPPGFRVRHHEVDPDLDGRQQRFASRSGRKAARSVPVHRRETRQPGPPDRARRQAGFALLGVAALIEAGQWFLYDATPVAQGNRTWALAMAAVLGVVAVRLVLTPTRQHELSLRTAMLAGGALTLVALLGPHERAAAAVVEGVCGLTALLAATVALSALGPPER